MFLSIFQHMLNLMIYLTLLNNRILTDLKCLDLLLNAEQRLQQRRIRIDIIADPCQFYVLMLDPIGQLIYTVSIKHNIQGCIQHFQDLIFLFPGTSCIILIYQCLNAAFMEYQVVFKQAFKYIALIA